jgi:hypothetical protein
MIDSDRSTLVEGVRVGLRALIDGLDAGDVADDVLLRERARSRNWDDCSTQPG